MRIRITSLINISILISVLTFSTGCLSRFRDSRFSYEKRKNSVMVFSDSSAIKLTIYRSDIMKVSYYPIKTDTLDEISYSVILVPDSSVKYQILENRKNLIITTALLKAEITKKPFVVNFYRSDGSPLLLSASGYANSDSGKTAAFKITKNESFYGMGQKGISIDRKGEAFMSYNKHIAGYCKPYANMQINIPYIYTSTGFGVFFDNTYPGYYDLGKTDSSKWTYKAENGPFNYFCVRGQDEKDLLKKYFDLTGYPKMLPKWAFGLLQSRCAYENEKQVYDVVKSFKRKNLPLDAIILDGNWFGGFTPNSPHNMGNFTWLGSNFPNPVQYLNYLKAEGIKTVLINEPYINLNSDNYNMLNDKGWLVKKKGSKNPFVFSPLWCGDASLLDITNPGAQKWQWSKMKDYLNQGVDGIWTDLNEPEYPVENGEFYLGGERKIHNIFALLYAKTIFEGFQKDFPDKRVFNLSRSGYAGIQRYGVVNWSGDASKTWEAFKLQIPMLIGASMSGLPFFTSDIGGFTRAYDVSDTVYSNYKNGKMFTTPELYIRWFQQGVFSPILRPHSGEDQACEPFAFDANTENITSTYLKLRYRLIPYIYSYAYKAVAEGEPIVRPLFFNFKESRARNSEYSYMFGNELLVAPVLGEGKEYQSVYLPDITRNNRWYNFWTDEPYQGGRQVSVEVPLEIIPVFVQQPAIFPLANVRKYTGQSSDDELTVVVYPKSKATFQLYEDDGTTYAYERGEYATTDLLTDMPANDLIIRINPANGSFPGMVKMRKWKFEIHLTRGFEKISINGQEIDSSQYELDSKTGILSIKSDCDVFRTLLIEITNYTLKPVDN